MAWVNCLPTYRRRRSQANLRCERFRRMPIIFAVGHAIERWPLQVDEGWAGLLGLDDDVAGLIG
eukprot:781017-Alexandrium_andersonii.AAC.1